MELQPRGRRFRYLTEPDLVLVIGCLLRVIRVVILNTTVEIDELGPAQERLELVQNEAVFALRLVRLAPTRAMGS